MLRGGSGLTCFRVPGVKGLSGLLTGTLQEHTRVSVDFEAEVELDYQGYSDIPGLQMNGPQVQNVDPKGVGSMAGAQQIELSTNAKSRPFTSAGLDYSDVSIEHGFADSGPVTVSVDGDEYEVDAADAFAVDFRGLLPLE